MEREDMLAEREEITSEKVLEAAEIISEFCKGRSCYDGTCPFKLKEAVSSFHCRWRIHSPEKLTFKRELILIPREAN